MVGKSNKSKADAAADTVASPSPPQYGPDPPAPAAPPRPSLAGGARSSERAIAASGAQSREGCLDKDEVRAYLRPRCPRSLRARVQAHTGECIACQQWVRHIDGEILEYVGGQRPEEELARMDAHLEACANCRDLVHHMVQSMARSWTGEEREVPDSSTTFSPGSVVNSRYRILSFVGRGGMGEVYEAFDQLMDRRIALKTVLCTVADRPRAARRFKEEVRNAQRVGHPHVCRINDLQEHHDGAFGPAVPFFTMEYIEGDRLGNRLMATPLPLEDVRAISLQLLSGLEAAHTRGVLHLDFKSDNVMLRRDAKTPDAVIMDFGLSRVLGNESRLRTSDRRQFAGTLPYMSVEQLECREDLGPATDIYAFGVVLYEMLTRAFPFEGDSLGAVLLKQLKERPRPPSRLVPDLTPALDRFVLKCLHSDPRARFPDAAQARATLEAIAHWSRPRGAARAWKAAAPLAVIALAAALIAASNMRRGAKPSSASTPSATGEAVQSATNALAPAPLQVVAAATPADAPVPLAAALALPAMPSPEVTAAPALPAVRATPLLDAPLDAAPPAKLRGPGALHAPAAASAATGPTSMSTTATSTTAANTASTTAAASAPATPAGRAPSALAPGAAPAASEDNASWKPARVPKRLSGHSPAGSSGPGGAEPSQP